MRCCYLHHPHQFIDRFTDAQPTHRIVFDTEYYTTGPQQSRAPDGTFKAGVEVSLISEAGSYVIVEDIDGLVGHVSRDAVQPLSEPK